MSGEPWRATGDAHTAHVTPADDPPHDLNGLCWCQPVYEDVGLEGRIYIHRRTLDTPHREGAATPVTPEGGEPDHDMACGRAPGVPDPLCLACQGEQGG